MVGDVLAWVQSGASIGLLALCSKLYVDNRKLRLEEKKVDLDENKDERDGYGQLIKALRDDVADVREQLKICKDEHTKTSMELDGLRRQFVSYQLAVAQAVPPSMRSPEIEAMVESLKGQQ